jgi:hypothetical protein
MQDESLSPVSNTVQVSRLPKKGLSITIDADADQRAALAKEHDLQAVDSFVAKLDVSAWKKGGIKVVGSVDATIVQSCVVTLEPIKQVISEDVSGMFLPEGSKLAVPARNAEGEILLDVEGEDGPELFMGDIVDVGKLAEEFFAMGIDPYPRKSGVDVKAVLGEDEEPRGPLYEKLKQLQSKT